MKTDCFFFFDLALLMQMQTRLKPFSLFCWKKNSKCIRNLVNLLSEKKERKMNEERKQWDSFDEHWRVENLIKIVCSQETRRRKNKFWTWMQMVFLLVIRAEKAEAVTSTTASVFKQLTDWILNWRCACIHQFRCASILSNDWIFSW